MVQRAVSAVMWFFVSSWLLSYASLYLGLPPIVGFVVAGGVAAFFALDPLKLIWPTRHRTPGRRAAPAEASRQVFPTDAPSPQAGR